MNLYEIDNAILGCIDMETGEIIDIDALETLQMERDAKIENVACWIKDLIAEAKQIKDEEAALAERRKAKEAKAEKLKEWLTRALDGTKFETAKCAVSFRVSHPLEIDDEAEFVNRLMNAQAYEFLNFAPPKIDKTKVTEELKAGNAFTGAKIGDKLNISVK